LINLFRSLAGPEILLITETLGPGHLTFPVVFSDSALKVVLTYYPVCRFQRTSGAGTFRATKKLNLAPTIIHVSVHHAGTKLSSNLQSQNMREPTLFVLRLRESRLRRIVKIALCARSSNGKFKFLQQRDDLLGVRIVARRRRDGNPANARNSSRHWGIRLHLSSPSYSTTLCSDDHVNL